MQTVPEYAPYLLEAQIRAAKTAGVDPWLVSRELWVMNLSLLNLIGMITKALHDKGVVLDAEWQTRLNAAYLGDWPQWMLQQVNPQTPPV